ncbi:MAG: hypothetical protein Q9208_008697 [Pyrenodesmia sp. 3 TL-2023]
MRPLSFQLTVPKTLTVALWEKTLNANLKSTLPSILRQLGVDASQVVTLASEGVPLVAEAITAIQSGQSIPDIPSDIARRELISNIGSWIRKIATSIAKSVQELIRDISCFIFSAVVIPGFMLLDLLMLVLNAGNGEATTADQDFFINPLYGSTSHDDDVQVHYNATSAFPGFAGFTFGNRIYLNHLHQHRWSAAADPPLLRDLNFRLTTTVLLHELTHVMQYKTFNDSHSAFAWAYLKGYCNAGFNYRRNPFEAEAIEKQRQVNKLLRDELGSQFMDKWKLNNWAATLGLPTAREYVIYPDRPGHYSLPFQHGVATLDCNPTSGCVGTSQPA